MTEELETLSETMGDIQNMLESKRDLVVPSNIVEALLETERLNLPQRATPAAQAYRARASR